jgi:hypothetical protein
VCLLNCGSGKKCRVRDLYNGARDKITRHVHDGLFSFIRWCVFWVWYCQSLFSCTNFCELPHRYILRKELTTFGSKNADVRLMSLAVVKEHCAVRFDGSNIFVIGKCHGCVATHVESL